MRLFALELRRVLTSRLTCALLALCLLLTAVLAFLPTTFVYSSVPAGDGSLVTLRGLEAIRHRNDLQSGITGVVTPDKVQRAIEAYQACLNEYGVLNAYELPEGVYETRILPYAPLLHSVKEAFADPDTGMAPWSWRSTPSRLRTFTPPATLVFSPSWARSRRRTPRRRPGRRRCTARFKSRSCSIPSPPARRWITKPCSPS